ncbi:MAG: hypothetical protein GX800_13050, partial [Clostridiaceae bacterium]|nr:hypothetical protein [Clostridiaceae bacterium]
YLDNATLSVDKSEFIIGESARASVIALRSDNSVADVSVEYSSSDPNIASIDPGNGQIIAVSPGEVKITATVTEKSVTVQDSIMIRIGHFNAPGNGHLQIAASDFAGQEVHGVSVVGDEFTPSFEINVREQYPVGTEFKITATEADGKTFQYWRDEASNRIISTSDTYTFRIGSDTHITAVYNNDESGMLVQFIDRNGKVIQSDYLNDSTTSVKAPPPFSVGYDFNAWKAGNLSIRSGELVTSITVGSKDTFFFADYSKSDILYNIEISGSNEDRTVSLKYDEPVTVTAPDSSDGKSFAYWLRNGRITSYNPIYSFYVWDNTSVSAVYTHDGENLFPLPQIIMDTVKPDTDRVMFAAERTIPEGFKLVECGILLTDETAYATPELFDLNIPNAIKAISQSKKENSQFTIRFDDLEGTWYARAYLIYEETEMGSFKIVYSNIVNGASL